MESLERDCEEKDIIIKDLERELAGLMNKKIEPVIKAEKDIEKINTSVNTLEGPKIVGKIELPVEKQKKKLVASSSDSFKHKKKKKKIIVSKDEGKKGEKKEEDWGDQDQEEKELIFKKEDLGEQTIDYAQLKKEFEEISVDGISNAKKTYGELSNVAEIKTYRKTVIGHEGQAEEMEFEEVDKDLVEEESFQVFEPNSLGIENFHDNS